jgi:hypothetical protein
MRWLVSMGSGVGIAVVVVACGGPPFTLAPAAEDAASDVVRKAGSKDASADGLDETGEQDVDVDRQDTSWEAAGQDVGAPPPHCGGGLACVPAAPSGWVGPFELYAGSDALPLCGARFSGAVLDGHTGLMAPPYACGCSCAQPPHDVLCSSPTVTFYADFQGAKCTAVSCASAALVPGACTSVDVTQKCIPVGVGGIGMAVSASTASQGSCTPLAIVGTAKSTWSINARACGPSFPPGQADCTAGNVCAPTPSSPFQPGLCIERQGDVACPFAGYPMKRLYHGAVADTRGCSSCSCGSVTGASCAGTINQYQSSDSTCASSPQVTFDIPLSCGPVAPRSILKLVVTPQGGSCTPSSSTPTGWALPALPMTFCCQQ